MLLTRLALTHFRNYRQLELDFAGPLALLRGHNCLLYTSDAADE